MDNHDYSNTPVDNSQVPRQDSFAGKTRSTYRSRPTGRVSGRTPSRRITRGTRSLGSRLIARIIGGISRSTAITIILTALTRGRRCPQRRGAKSRVSGLLHL